MAGSMHVVSQVSEIMPNIYLTSVYGATKENILKKKITLLINAAQELPKQEIPGVETIKLFLDDTPYAIINVYFDRIADKIAEHLSRGGKCMIHCVLGVSRSTSLLLAYLMKHKSMNLRHAYEYVQARRSCIRPNPGFWRQLVDYEKRILINLPNHAAINGSSSGANNGALSSRSTNETSIPITIVNTSTGSNNSKYISSVNTSNYNSSTNRPGSSSSFDPKQKTDEFFKFLNTVGTNQKSSTHQPTSSFVMPSSSVSSSYTMHNYQNPPQHQQSALSSSKIVYPESQHRTSLLVDPNSKYARPSNFSTTYRASYGKF
jgi:atypical dual specificity phosphatase